jgi:hypothetical protein
VSFRTKKSSDEIDREQELAYLEIEKATGGGAGGAYGSTSQKATKQSDP